MASVVSTAADRSAYKGAQAVRGRAMGNIIRLGRIDTGKMITQLQVRRAPALAAKFGPNGAAYVVGTNAKSEDGFPYPIVQEKGSKAHGPVKAKFLVFKPKGSSSFVFAKKVRGVRPGHFMRDAVRASKVSDFTR
jgi:hypothetical protein